MSAIANCDVGLVSCIPPAVITDAMLLSSNVAESDYAVWSSGTTYGAGDRVIMTTGVHKIYESSVAGNVGNNPATSPTIWQEISATNRWAMFDNEINTQTTNSGSIVVELQPNQRIDALTLLNVSATSVRVEVTAAALGKIYDQSLVMQDLSDITDMYRYFYGQAVDRSTLTLTNLPPHQSAVIKVTITRTGGAAACGLLVIGQQIAIGQLQYGYSIGNKSYAKKIEDENGRVTVKKGNTAKIGQFGVIVNNNRVDYLLKELPKYSATPAMYVCGTSYDAQSIFGFYENLEMVIPHSLWSDYSMKINGII